MGLVGGGESMEVQRLSSTEVGGTGRRGEAVGRTCRHWQVVVGDHVVGRMFGLQRQQWSECSVGWWVGF